MEEIKNKQSLFNNEPIITASNAEFEEAFLKGPMGSTAVIGNEKVLRTLQGARSAVFLLEGEDGLGKTYVALNHIAAQLCQNGAKNKPVERTLKTIQPCGNCAKCEEVFSFKSVHVFFLSLKNRFSHLQFLYLQLLQALPNPNELNEENKSSVTNEPLSPLQARLAELLYREVCRLLSLHRSAVLPLHPPSARLSENVQPLKGAQLEEKLHAMYFWLNGLQQINNPIQLALFLLEKKTSKTTKKTNSKTFIASELAEGFNVAPMFFSNVQALQNCLQRSVYLKASLDKMFAWCAVGFGLKAVVLDGLQHVQDSAAGSFLKLLEEPPENIRFYITTKSVNKLSPALRLPLLSRLTKLGLKPFSNSNFMQLATRQGFAKTSAFNWAEKNRTLNVTGFLLSHLYALQKTLLGSYWYKGVSNSALQVNVNRVSTVNSSSPFPMHKMVFNGINTANVSKFKVPFLRQNNAGLFYALQFLAVENFNLLNFLDEVLQLISMVTTVYEEDKEKQNELASTFAMACPAYIAKSNIINLHLIFKQTHFLASKLKKRLVSPKNAFSQWWLFVKPLTGKN